MEMLLRRRQAFWACSLFPYGDYMRINGLAVT